VAVASAVPYANLHLDPAAFSAPTMLTNKNVIRLA